MPYRSYFLALLGVNLLVLLCSAVFLMVRTDIVSQLVKRVKQGPVARWTMERRKFDLYKRTMKPGAIIMLGNSLTEQAEWHELLGDARVVNRGISGETTDRMLDRAADLTEPRPALVCLMAGINDLLYYRRPVARVEQQYDSLIDVFAQRGIPVLVFSTLPTHFDQDVNRQVTDLNAHLKQRAAQSPAQVRFVDLWPAMTDGGKLRRDISMDGLHLNEKGYTVWAGELDKTLDDLGLHQPPGPHTVGK